MRLLVAVVIVLALVAMACGSDESTTDTGDRRVLTEAENGEEVLLDAGEQFQVRLESNASTGYSWEMAAETGPFAFELRTRSYEEPEGDLVGAAGTEV